MRRTLATLAASCLAVSAVTGAARAGDMPIDSFDAPAEARWQFFADTVMGGVSEGRMTFLTEDGANFARLEGKVSTANNGGFIQMRIRLDMPPPASARGIRLVARGNGETYFVHLRTRGTALPWQYYQAPFPTSDDWQEVRIPLTAFKPSGQLLRATPRATGIRSVAVVAFGREHAARVDLRYLGFYD